MLQITSAAMTLLRTALNSEQSTDDLFRLVVADNSLALARVPAAEDGDVTYEQDGVVVLAAPPEIAEDLKSQIIDLEANSDSPRLIVVSQ